MGLLKSLAKGAYKYTGAKNIVNSSKDVFTGEGTLKDYATLGGAVAGSLVPGGSIAANLATTYGGALVGNVAGEFTEKTGKAVKNAVVPDKVTLKSMTPAEVKTMYGSYQAPTYTKASYTPVSTNVNLKNLSDADIEGYYKGMKPESILSADQQALNEGKISDLMSKEYGINQASIDEQVNSKSALLESKIEQRYKQLFADTQANLARRGMGNSSIGVEQNAALAREQGAGLKELGLEMADYRGSLERDARQSMMQEKQMDLSELSQLMGYKQFDANQSNQFNQMLANAKLGNQQNINAQMNQLKIADIQGQNAVDIANVQGLNAANMANTQAFNNFNQGLNNALINLQQSNYSSQNALAMAKMQSEYALLANLIGVPLGIAGAIGVKKL